MITKATLVSKLLYATPVWWGFADSETRFRLQSITAKTDQIWFPSQKSSTLWFAMRESRRKFVFIDFGQWSSCSPSIAAPYKRYALYMHCVLECTIEESLKVILITMMRRNFIPIEWSLWRHTKLNYCLDRNICWYIIRRSLTVDLSHALVRALILTRLDYCNRLLGGASGGATPGHARSNDLVKKQMTWSLTWPWNIWAK